MSEVGDALQVVLVMGKASYVLGQISIKSALAVLKLLNTLYLAKWKGKTSLSRLRQIKGEDFVFLNVATEDQKILSAIEQEMKQHAILYARMPDLCGGDHRTQYAMAQSEAAKLKSLLLDHSKGKNGWVQLGPITASDYLKTAETVDGSRNETIKELETSAKETLSKRRVTQKRFPKQDASKKTDKTRNKGVEPDRRLQEKNKEQTKKTMDTRQKKADIKEHTTPPSFPREELQQAMEHHENSLMTYSQDEQKRMTLLGKPFYQQEENHYYFMPDHTYVLYLTGNIIEPDKIYTLLNMTTNEVYHAKGTLLINQFQNQEKIRNPLPFTDPSLEKINQKMGALHQREETVTPQTDNGFTWRAKPLYKGKTQSVYQMPDQIYVLGVPVDQIKKTKEVDGTILDEVSIRPDVTYKLVHVKDKHMISIKGSQLVKKLREDRPIAKEELPVKQVKDKTKPDIAKPNIANKPERSR